MEETNRTQMQEKIQNEKLLLDDLRNGSEHAFEQIFKYYWKKLYTVARAKVTSDDDAQEILQAIFTNLWEKRATLLINDLSFYLHACVKNAVLNLLRSRITREKYWNYYKTFFPSTADATDEIISVNDLDSAFNDLVQGLPEKSREVFKLSRIEGKSNAEIAAIMALSEKAIEYHLTKSLRILRVRLRDFIA
jgi:RNA polymerase sigma-70 factor (family 1)